MKEVIKLPAVFLLIFIIVLIIFTFFNLLASLISAYSDFSQLNAAIFFGSLPYAAFTVLPGVLMLSLLIVLLNFSLKSAPRFFAVIVLFFTVFAVFTGSLGILGKLLTAESGILPGNYFIKGQFNNAGTLLIYPGNINKNQLQDVLVFSPENGDYHFSFYKQLESTVKDNTVTINIADKKISQKMNSPYTRFLYEYDQFSGDILQAFGVFNRDLLNYAQKSGFIFYYSCFAFIFFIMACGMFTRITRWPLFNLLLFSVIITLFIIVYSFYKTELYNELAGMLKNNVLLDYLPLHIMAGAGMLFILVDIIFIPRKYWKEGITID